MAGIVPERRSVLYCHLRDVVFGCPVNEQEARIDAGACGFRGQGHRDRLLPRPNARKILGRVDSSVRSTEQTAVARFWTDHDIPQWNRNLLRLADARGLTAIETARMLAMAHVAGGDAMIGCFDAKYHYLSWRPIHAINRAHTDGNSFTLPDPAWQPLLPTPNHPEYPSAHACRTTAIAEALESFFGTGHLRFSVDSLVTGETRDYKRFKEAVDEVNNARVWGGFHFRYSQDEGTTLGRKIARFVVRNFFQPLD
jgi:hypothetical protein